MLKNLFKFRFVFLKLVGSARSIDVLARPVSFPFGGKPIRPLDNLRVLETDPNTYADW